MALERNSKKIKNQSSLEFIVILSVVIIITIMVVVYFTYFIHNVSIGSPDEIISAQASSSNTLLLKLTNLLPKEAQIIGINFTGVPSGTSVSVSLKNQTPIYNNGYPEYTFSVNGLANPLTFYNISDLVYNENGKTIAVSTLSGEPMPIEETSTYTNTNSNSNSFPQPTSIPSGIVAYVPIIITNTQGLSTHKPFQQMIQIQESKFSNYIAYNNNIANFEFFTQSGQILPAWIESNTLGNLIIWVKIPGIPAKHSQTIYLGFASQKTNLLSSSGNTGIGEAPQLSPTYAEYDDGVSVFNYYTNFEGNSLPANWGVYVHGDGSYLIDNGITVGTDHSKGKKGINLGIAYNEIQNYPQIADAYIVSDHITGGIPTAGIEVFKTLVYGSDGFENGYNFGASGSMTSESEITVYNSYGRNTEIARGSGTSTPFILSALWDATGNEIQYENYVKTISATDRLPRHYSVSIGNYYFGFIDAGEFYQHYTTYQWFRLRDVPPNDVMPTPSFGPVQTS